jgi:hypothetical protein
MGKYTGNFGALENRWGSKSTPLLALVCIGLCCILVLMRIKETVLLHDASGSQNFPTATPVVTVTGGLSAVVSVDESVLLSAGPDSGHFNGLSAGQGAWLSKIT